MNCNETCRLFGMYQMLSGIEDNVVLLHTVVGCQFATLMHSFHTRQDKLNACCTVINDKDIIFNGEESLAYAIERVVRYYQPKSITVLTGCVAEIIKDDVQQVIAQCDYGIPIQHFSGAGFTSTFEAGYEDALLQFVKDNSVQSEVTTPSVNLLGTLKDDYKLAEDVAELRRVLSHKVELNCVVGACTWDELCHLSLARLNLVFHRGLPAAQYMKEHYGIPYVVVDYPYGITKSQALLTVLEEQLSVDFSQEKTVLANEVITAFTTVYSHLKSFYHCYVGLYSAKAKLDGLSYFLEEELGMNVITGDKSICTYQNFINQFDVISPAILFGSSFEGGVAEQLGTVLFPIEYPVFTRVSIGNQPYAMGRGALNLVNDLLNMLMICKDIQDKGAFYREKNMCLR